MQEEENRKVRKEEKKGIRYFSSIKSCKYFAITSFFFYFATVIKIRTTIMYNNIIGILIISIQLLEGSGGWDWNIGN